MLAKRVNSLQHPKVLHWVKLHKERTYRIEHDSVLISGEKLIREMALLYPLKALITLSETPEIEARERFLVNAAILKKITSLQTPDGFAAEIALPSPSDLFSLQKLLILDKIADPGNLGTLLRTAHALGWDGVAATPGTVDFFNDKALRAAKGATFKIPLAYATPETLCTWSKQKKIPCFIADTEGSPLSTVSIPAISALILSNESEGPSEWTKAIGKKISIPMANDAESLNVASAGAILLYTMRVL
ncbi:MAG: RNA methyltransferase [Chlamydiia bacterium]|nr:RNA methyltransferase [Chlamydiia bacterium]